VTAFEKFGKPPGTRVRSASGTVWVILPKDDPEYLKKFLHHDSERFIPMRHLETGELNGFRPDDLEVIPDRPCGGCYKLLPYDSDDYLCSDCRG
jgi:hypothetical protein